MESDPLDSHENSNLPPDSALPHQMLLEIHEQPQALRRTLNLYLREDGLRPEFGRELDRWVPVNGHVVIAASGSSRHSGLAAEIWLEEIGGLAVDVEYASEYNFAGPDSPSQSACLVLSQSGETSDTLAALRAAKKQLWKTLAITNAPLSTMAREADISMLLAAGPERAIPATKSFTCQLAALYILALYEAVRAGKLDSATLPALAAELWAQCAQIERQLPAWQPQMAALAKKYSGASTFLYLGSGIHYAIAREGALKLKEASYVHAEGYPMGELRHGPNALVSDSVPLVLLAAFDPDSAPSVQRYEKTLRLLRDLNSQGARVIAVANAGDRAIRELAADCVEVERASDYLLPLSEVVPLQLFAYFMALERGVNMDHPRNLSKAVVEP
ncbi:MAG: SIS domain-containing protein [Terracidiphilus sp.]|jgi:glucosamine--fructose-6-phosphate aminotransferase (isomerizing)